MVQLIHKRSEERETLQKAELPENDKRCIIKENTSPGNVKSNMVFICGFNIKKKKHLEQMEGGSLVHQEEG